MCGGLLYDQELRDGISTTFWDANDFNGDGRQDLAVGVRAEDSSAGAVNVLYGSASGITATADQFFRQGVGGLADTAEGGDLFGSSLAAGDLNGDGRDDLAVGVPGEDVGASGFDHGASSLLVLSDKQQDAPPPFRRVGTTGVSVLLGDRTA
jgi:hypothetical protein